MAEDTRSELRMLVDVRFLGSQVLFSATNSICFSPSPPPQLLLERAAAHLPRPWRAAGRSIRPAAWSSCPFVALRAPLRLGVVLLLVRRTRARGRGGEGGTTIAFFGTISATPGARSPPLATRSRPFDPGAARTSRMFAILRA